MNFGNNSQHIHRDLGTYPIYMYKNCSNASKTQTKANHECSLILQSRDTLLYVLLLLDNPQIKLEGEEGGE